MSQPDESQPSEILRDADCFASFAITKSELPAVASGEELQLVPRSPSAKTMHTPARQARRRPRWWQITVATSGLLAAFGVAAVIDDLWGQLLPDAALTSIGQAHLVELEESMLLQIDARPAQVRLFVDGVPVASNTLRLPKDGRLHRVLGVAAGHKSLSVPFYADSDQQVRMTLHRRPR